MKKAVIIGVVLLTCLVGAYLQWSDWLPFYLPIEPADRLARRKMIVAVRKEYADAEVKGFSSFEPHPDKSYDGLLDVRGHNAMGMVMDYKVQVHINMAGEVNDLSLVNFYEGR
jgi:hypothetical protein